LSPDPEFRKRLEQFASKHGVDVLEKKARAGVLGIAAVDLVAGKARVVAKILAARAAEEASAVGEAEPRHANALADGEASHLVADSFYTPHDLVAEYERKLRMREIAVEHMKIRAAHAASDDFDEDLVGLWPGQRQLCRAERLARPIEQHRLHPGWRHYDILHSEGRLLRATPIGGLDPGVRLAEPALFPTVAKHPSAFASRRKQDIKLVVTTIIRLAHPSERVGFAAHCHAL